MTKSFEQKAEFDIHKALMRLIAITRHEETGQLTHIVAEIEQAFLSQKQEIIKQIKMKFYEDIVVSSIIKEIEGI